MLEIILPIGAVIFGIWYWIDAQIEKNATLLRAIIDQQDKMLTLLDSIETNTGRLPLEPNSSWRSDMMFDERGAQGRH